MRTLLQLDDREQATIKAALECYADHTMRDLYLETANDHGALSALGLDEVHKLSERVSTSCDFGTATQICAEHQGAEEPHLGAYVDAAGDQNCVEEGVCEISDAGIVSESGDGGAYVLAWVWVSDEDAGIETNDDEDEEGEDDEA